MVAITKIVTTVRLNQFQNLMKDHAQKLLLLYKNFDVSSYTLDLFEMLVLCRGLLSLGRL